MIKHFQLNNSEKSRNFAKTNDVQAKPNNESFSLEKHVRFVSAFKYNHHLMLFCYSFFRNQI